MERALILLTRIGGSAASNEYEAQWKDMNFEEAVGIKHEDRLVGGKFNKNGRSIVVLNGGAFPHLERYDRPDIRMSDDASKLIEVILCELAHIEKSTRLLMGIHLHGKGGGELGPVREFMTAVLSTEPKLPESTKKAVTDIQLISYSIGDQSTSVLAPIEELVRSIRNKAEFSDSFDHLWRSLKRSFPIVYFLQTILGNLKITMFDLSKSGTADESMKVGNTFRYLLTGSVPELSSTEGLFPETLAILPQRDAAELNVEKFILSDLGAEGRQARIDLVGYLRQLENWLGQGVLDPDRRDVFVNWCNSFSLFLSSLAVGFSKN